MTRPNRFPRAAFVALLSLAIASSGCGSSPLDAGSASGDTILSASVPTAGARSARADAMAAPVTTNARELAVASVASVSPDLGDVHGGAPITVTVESSEGVTGVLIGDTPCTNLAIPDSTHVTAFAPAKPAGLYDVVVTNTVGASVVLRGGYEAWHPNVDFGAARVFQSDRGITAGATASRAYTGLIADRLKEGWINRDGAPLLRLSSGRILMIGGWHPEAWGPSPEGDVTNAIEFSDDDGTTWKTLLADDRSPPISGPRARFAPGHTAGVLLHQAGGTEYVYWIGSDANGDRDGGVWRSADGGTTWARISTSAPTADRSLFATVSYNGNLYVMGGQYDLGDPASAFSEVWRSEDDGVTWSRLPDAPWAPRGGIYSPVVFRGRVYLVGGATYAPDSAGRTYYNDVWSFDDAHDTWTKVLANGHSQWEGRHYHSVLVYRDKLWIINGWKHAYVENGSNDVYSSPDGMTWTAYDQIDWYATHGQGAVVTPRGIVMDQGIANESFVKLEELAGSTVSAWDDQGSDALTLRQPVARLRPVLAPQALGAQPAVALLGDEMMSLAAVDRGITGGVLEIWAVGRTLNSQTLGFTSIPSPIVGCASPLDPGASMSDFGMSGGTLMYVDRSSGVTIATGGSGLNDDRVRLVGVEHRAGSLKLFSGGVQVGSTSTTGSFDTTYTGWDSLGADVTFDGVSDRGRFLMGAFVVLKTDAASSPAFRVKLAKWAKKWGA